MKPATRRLSVNREVLLDFNGPASDDTMRGTCSCGSCSCTCIVHCTDTECGGNSCAACTNTCI